MTARYKHIVNSPDGNSKVIEFTAEEREAWDIKMAQLEADMQTRNDAEAKVIADKVNAKTKLKSKTSEEISKATGGLGIPGFKLPF